jgi:xanthine/CO dehydrogenase XdhC/CoxF family maturation factor
MPAETRQLLALWSDARSRGEECALATVVRVAGSSYRKPGARMLLTRAARRAGTVSGGCLEGEVARKIWWLTEDGPVVQDYNTSYDDDSNPSYGLGCDGVVTLLLERASAAEAVLASLRDAVESRIPTAIVTVIGARDNTLLGRRTALAQHAPAQPANGHPGDLSRLLLQTGRETLRAKETKTFSASVRGSDLELFAEYIAPPPALFVFGAGDDAQPLVHLARSMGWEITVADGRSNLATPARFPLAHHVVALDGDDLRNLAIRPGDSAVVLTHSYVQDVLILRALLPLQLGYLGVLGPRRRTERIVDEVAPSLGIEPATVLESLRSPVGLDLGAGSPEVIALSIVAEIQAALTSRSATPLNLSTNLAIHG